MALSCAFNAIYVQHIRFLKSDISRTTSSSLKEEKSRPLSYDWHEGKKDHTKPNIIYSVAHTVHQQPPLVVLHLVGDNQRKCHMTFGAT
jgi:hypothetical protein